MIQVNQQKWPNSFFFSSSPTWNSVDNNAFDRFKYFESRVENWKAFFNPFFGNGIKWRISSELFICLETIKKGFKDIKCFSTFAQWNLFFSLSLSLFLDFICYVCDLCWVDLPNVVYAGHNQNPKRIKSINIKLENDFNVTNVAVVHSFPDLFQTKFFYSLLHIIL